MNRTKLKNYAPKARRDFIEAVIHRASIVGIFPDRIAPVEEKGDVVIICGNPFPKQVAHQRSQLEKKVKERGFDQVMEAMAYTWFNRIVALRYMELHGYLDHGYRVLSHPQGKPTPEILEHAEHVSLPGLDSQNIINLKLDGIREADLYRMVLVAQCNALHDAMPFLFERIDDGKELLLPDNLLHSDSLIRKMVEEIDEADWKEVEIIGWLYQFYISEKKDKVIGKVVASDDIPAATQLFTPNWIVKYLVQNTLGRQWLATYPESVLRQKMEYYIEPAQQTPEVQKQLSTITPTSLNPEELTFLDPACGSGHILVEAYDLFKAVYQERGYQAKDIPTLILQKNLFGLEIDDRAAQLAAFALMMKARADDRRIFDKATKPNVAAIRGSNGLNAADLAHALNSRISKETSVETDFVSQADIASLLELFKDAKTFGSLIQIPSKLMAKLPEIENRLHDVLKFGDLTQASAHVLRPLLQQARLLAVHYDAVVANPPYMGSKYYTPTLKTFVNREYQTAKADLYACFMERNRVFCKPGGFNGMINIPNWMFLSSFEELRKELFASQTIDTFVHNGRGVFGSDFGSCAFVIRNKSIPLFKATYRRLFEDSSSVSSNEEIAERYFSKQSYLMDANSLRKIPGAPLAYWLSAALADLFAKCPSAESLADARQGLATGGNDLFMRYWHEVNVNGIGFGVNSREDARTSRLRWFVCNKGGPFRRWYGNLERVVDWQNDGQRVKAHTDKDGSVLSRPQNQDVYFREGITWSDVTISYSSFRLLPKGVISDATGHSAYFVSEVDRNRVMCFCNTSVAQSLISAINPTVHFHIGYFKKLPVPEIESSVAKTTVDNAVRLAKSDWDSHETSWDFTTLPVLQHKQATVQASQKAADADCLARFVSMKKLEEDNNRLYINTYGLQNELSPEVPDDQITLHRPDRTEEAKRLLSYGIGCMMGRYSLDQPGLILANAGHSVAEYIAKVGKPLDGLAFRPDEDGIIPITEARWFPDDATERLAEFIAQAWPREHLEENLKFIADALESNRDEHPRDTIRRYLATGFYKDHLSTYKKRPIYWLFSSGKQRAFQALVYLHRYAPGTLARMRTEYVIPLQGKIRTRIEQLAGDIPAATSTSHRRKLEKERETLIKQQAELATFDEKLRHYADQRITLDLDDGVKVNYGKFGDLLADVKAVTGGKDE